MHRFAGFAVCLLITLSIHAGTWIVTNTNDSGSSSLREAISESNTTPGADVITFQIGGGGVKTITLSSALPQITDVLTIDGFTQSGASANTSSNSLNAVVLIEIDCATANIAGLSFGNGSTGSIVRGLAIGRCALSGITIGNGASITVAGNYIGTDATGTVARLNAVGVFIDGGSSGNQIGVANDPAARNLISGNNFGLFVTGPNNTITRNLIGTTASGTIALPNTNGIMVRASNNDIVMNVISGNIVRGIYVTDGITGTVIDGCAIGTAVNGTSALGNGTGIVVSDGTGGAPADTTITNNIIRFNTADGIELVGGTDNEKLRTPSTNGLGKPATNANPLGTRIDDNEIRDNGALGIDLDMDGVTLNDALDADSGANELQNFPVVTSAVASGSTIAISGTLQSLPNASFNVQLFHNDACDASGYGEGAFILGELTVTTDGAGNGSFNTSFSSSATTGVITATATEIASGNTSEFSLCEDLVADDAQLSVDDMSIVEGNAGTSNATVTVTLAPASSFDVQVSYATSNGSATSPSDYTPATGTLTFPAGTTTQTFTIPIIGDPTVEGDETINVTLSSPSNATISDGNAVVTITNDDSGAAPAAVPIPTLTEIGLTLFAAAIALLAFLRLR